MGIQRRLGIYVGFDSPSIIKYLEPLTGDVFTARSVDCYFNETNFPTLGGGIKELEKEITWNVSLLSHLDPRIDQCELKVQKILHLQNIANWLQDAFVDVKKVTKSHIAVANIPSNIDNPKHMLSLINLEHARRLVV